jgi:hypothetical protein
MKRFQFLKLLEVLISRLRVRLVTGINKNDMLWDAAIQYYIYILDVTVYLFRVCVSENILPPSPETSTMPSRLHIAYCLLRLLSSPKDQGSMPSETSVNFLPDYMASHPKEE